MAGLSAAFTSFGYCQTSAVTYYWVRGGVLRTSANTEQSFVVPVTAAQASQIEQIKQSGGQPSCAVQIAAGADNYNRDYLAPGQPSWSWHVVKAYEVVDLRHTGYLACECPFLVDPPSTIAADAAGWIQKNGDTYNPEYAQITSVVDPTNIDHVANVSNRGVAGSGERSLISGLIVSGGQPRNIVVRTLGPSLTGSGVQQVVTNPKLEVYSSSGRLIASNADWKSDARASTLSSACPALAPKNESEAAVLLTLLPGAYTVKGISEDGSEGVMLIEAYDVDIGAK